MEDVIEAMLSKLDKLAAEYKEKKTTQSLIDFIHYRDDYIRFSSEMLWLGGLVSSDTSWMIQCYVSVITDETGAFDDGQSVPDKKFVSKIKKWRKQKVWLK